MESYGTELVNNAESKIVKLESEIQAKESIISDLQYGGTGFLFVLTLIIALLHWISF